MNVQESPLTRKLGAFVALSNAELTILDDLHRRRRSFNPGADLVHEGQMNQSAYVLAEGWVCSYKLLRGGSRQIVDFQIPGDFLGLRSVLFRTADHNIEPITRVEASEILAGDLLDVFSRTPRLATAVLWAASRDEAMLVEHLVGLGRRSAVERTAHFLLELWARLSLVGQSTPQGYACPLSQYMLADALGLSAVHINRVLRELRETGLLTFNKGTVVFDDFDGLVHLAQFEINISIMTARCSNSRPAGQTVSTVGATVLPGIQNHPENEACICCGGRETDAQMQASRIPSTVPLRRNIRPHSYVTDAVAGVTCTG